MNKMKKSIIALPIAAAALAMTMAALAGCSSTDVVGKFANSSFKAMADASKDRVKWSNEDQAWTLAAPDGEEFSLSSDFSRNEGSGGMADMEKPDAEFSFDAAPFVAAGLDIAKLPMTEGIKYELEEGRFMIHFELGKDKFSPEAKKSMDAAFAEIARTERARIGYHEKLDHYGIKLGGGDMLEWAKDLASNDKDLVFALDPEPFKIAGIDPAKIRGWTLAKVETKDDAGKTVLVDKLLKFYDLR
jgi:hypothetical protein